MTARQLREYVYQHAREAEKRIASLDKDEKTSRAFRDALNAITYSNGKVKKSTSNLSKEEMRELAYNYRIFESLDTTSGYAKSIDWKENKAKYHTFIKNQLMDPLTKGYWEKYITEKGNISKKGYEVYKRYVGFIKNISAMIEAYGYETIKEYAQEASKDPDRAKVIEKILMDVYFQSEGKGLTQAQLNDAFQIALREYDSRHAAKASEPSKVTNIKYKAPASKTTVKVKQGRKLKTSATVRRKLT